MTMPKMQNVNVMMVKTVQKMRTREIVVEMEPQATKRHRTEHHQRPSRLQHFRTDQSEWLQGNWCEALGRSAELALRNG